VGQGNSELISKHFLSWGKMQQSIQAAKTYIGEEWADLISIDGMGEAAGGSLVDFFNAPQNARVIDNLLKHITIIDADPPSSDSPVSGKTVVFTGVGHFDMGNPRARIALKIDFAAPRFQMPSPSRETFADNVLPNNRVCGPFGGKAAA